MGGDNFDVVTLSDDSSSDEPNSKQQPALSIKKEVVSQGFQNAGFRASEGVDFPARNDLKRARPAIHNTKAPPTKKAKEFRDAETQTEGDAEKEEKKVAPEPIPAKTFIFNRRLMNVESWSDDDRVGSRFVEHFGTQWNFGIFRNKNYLGIRISNDNTGVMHGNDQWSMEIGYSLTMKSGPSCEKTVQGTYEFGSHQEDAESCFLYPKFVRVEKVAGLTLDFELRVTILSMRGFYSRNLTEFDESVAETSDAILVVNNQKFFVSRLFLARQSSYFKTMFLGPFADAKMPEVPLYGVDPEDVQKYLEVLHGENAIDDCNVEAMIVLADMYDSPQITRKCVEFLQKNTRKPLKTIFEIAMRHPLETLKNTVLKDIRDHWQIREVIPENLEDLDHSVMAILLKRALAIR